MKNSRRIHVGEIRIGKEEKELVNEVLESGKISEGEKVREFEKEFAKFIGTKFAIAVSSGTAALISGITALSYHKDLDINPNTNVITTPLTYIATSNSLVLTGFNPVYVDIDPETFVITPENIEARLEEVDDISRYSFILPVHLMGYPCDMDKINNIAKKYSLMTLEDSSEATGTLYKGKKTGTFSLLSTFSFYIAHNIQVGEMGAVVTDDREIARLVEKIKAHGRLCDCPICVRGEGRCPKSFKDDAEDIDPRFTFDLVGYNFKTVEFLAALGISQLKKADQIIEKRRENVRYLNEELEKYSDILQLPKYSEDVSYLAYPVVIKKPKIISRKKLRSQLEDIGVETRPMFGCIPTQQPSFSHLKGEYEGKLPNADNIGRNGFYVGCHQYLTQEDLDYMVEALDQILKNLR